MLGKIKQDEFVKHKYFKQQQSPNKLFEVKIFYNINVKVTDLDVIKSISLLSMHIKYEVTICNHYGPKVLVKIKVF